MGLINYKQSEMSVERPVLLPVERHVVPLERFQGGVFESFVSEGSVSPVGVTEREKPVVSEQCIITV